MKTLLLNVLMLGLASWAMGCAQEKIELPNNAGTCGPYYPGDSADTDNPTQYKFMEEGATAPCAVWESARVGEQGATPNTYINLGELHLQYRWSQDDEEISEELKEDWGLDDPTHLLIIVSAENCSNCADVIDSVQEQISTFEENGTLIMGVCGRDQNAMAKPLSMEEADHVLIEKEHWPMEWPRTNDVEEYFPLGSMSYPVEIVVRLRDMKVILHAEGTATADYILEEIQANP